MSTGKLVEEVTLNWTDLTGKKTGATSLGSNKFYKAQIFDEGGSFRVVFTYGRVGQAGQVQEVVARTLPAAKVALDKKVKEKVGPFTTFSWELTDRADVLREAAGLTRKKS